MSEKVVIQLETLTRLADGFRESRGIANNLTTEQMITLAQEPIKPEQEKIVDITENGAIEITADEGCTLSRVVANVNVPTASGVNRLNQALAGTLTEVTAEDLEGVTELNIVFSYNYLLEKVEIPSHIQSINATVFNSANNKPTALLDLYYSSTIPTIKIGNLYGGRNLNLHFPTVNAFNDYMEQFKNNTSTSIHQNANLQYLYINGEAVSNLTIASTVTVLMNTMFDFKSKQLKNITFLGDIFDIKMYPFGYWNSSAGDTDLTIDFTHCTTVPQIRYATNSFPPSAIIKVRTALYEQWISATNWANYADMIVAV